MLTLAQLTGYKTVYTACTFRRPPVQAGISKLGYPGWIVQLSGNAYNRFPPTRSIISMVKLINPADKTFGEYGEDGYADVVTERVYEEHRFQANRKGRRKAHHELAMVEQFVAGLPATQMVLDVPCGMGRFTESIRNHGHTPVCLDLNIGMIQRARRRHGDQTFIIKGDALALPFRDQAFDAVICFRLLHHLPDNMILEVLAELKRVSKVALITFYDANCFRYRRKKLLGKRVGGQYYTAAHMFALCRDAGWASHKHLNPFDFHRNLHGIQLG